MATASCSSSSSVPAGAQPRCSRSTCSASTRPAPRPRARWLRPGRALHLPRAARRPRARHGLGLQYARAVLSFSLVSALALYALQRLQGALPLNPADMKGVRPDLAFNTAVSFVTNTNWQSYSPELTMSYLTQMAGLAVQNFASAAVGMAVAVALVRGFCRSESRGIGNFWADLVRGTLYVLLPLSLVVGVVLLARGVVQTFDGPAHVKTLAGADADDRARPVRRPGGDQGARHQRRRLVQRQLGAPLREPDAVHEPARDLSLLLIPFAMPFLFGRMLGRMREGIAILAAMLLLLGTGYGISLASETRTTPALTAAGPHARAEHGGQGAALQRPGGRDLQRSRRPAPRPARSTPCTTRSPRSAARCPMTLILLGEVAPGGVGTGLYSILLFATLTVFIARPDGRAHAGVPGQVDRRARGQAGDARRARDAGRLPRSPSASRRCSTTASPARSTPGRTASARSSTRSPRPGTTTARPSPA